MMARVSFPARCAVSVICGEHLVSQVYPAAVPVESFVDSIVELLNDDLKRRGAQGLDPTESYELQRANGRRLDVSKTLDELGVEDGTTLVLAPAGEGEPFEPQYEALSTGLARMGKRLFAPVTAETALRTAVAIVALMMLTITALAIYTRAQTDSPLPAVLPGVVGTTTIAGALWVWRWWPDRADIVDGLAWAAALPVSVGVGSAAPGSLGAAHLFTAALAMAGLAATITLLTGRNITPGATVVTLAAVTVLAAGARMVWSIPAQWLGMSGLVGLLFLLSTAPTIALWVARIRPPHFGSITGSDVFRRNDGMPVDAVAPVDQNVEGEPETDPTPQGVVIARAAKRANSVLTGICVAAAAVLSASAWATLLPGQPRGAAAVVLVALFVWIFISRARAFADRRHAVALVVGAAAAVCVAVTRYVTYDGGHSVRMLSVAVLVLAGFALAGLAAAVLVPATKFTPLVRMVTEWLELAAIVAALPLAAWIGGLFTWVRMR